ncbi:MAG: aminopeptidase P family protein [Euryarchaeota archaeon]|nr:aminopeptidase P family protein [Euryarchaeota archaeon]
MLSRVKKVLKRVGRKADAIVVANGVEPHIDLSFFYLTGLDHGLFEGSVAVAKPDGLTIITSVLEEESARHAEADVLVFKSADERKRMLQNALKGCKKVGINPPEMTHKWYATIQGLAKRAKLVDVSEEIVAARLVKDEKEVELMREACAIASEAAEDIIEFIKPGVKEYELAAELSYMMQKSGASGTAFESIVAFGPMSAEPHYIAGAQKLKKGQFVLLDFGAQYRKYRSDITRTYVSGRATPKQRDMYQTVLGAQLASIKKVKAGLKGGGVHDASQKVIDRSKYKGRFTHSVGHSIGLSVHDGGRLHPTIDMRLHRGMIFTVEPGIYLPGYGGVRIEDDVLVTKSGCELLTDARKELIEIS